MNHAFKTIRGDNGHEYVFRIDDWSESVAPTFDLEKGEKTVMDDQGEELVFGIVGWPEDRTLAGDHSLQLCDIDRNTPKQSEEEIAATAMYETDYFAQNDYFMDESGDGRFPSQTSHSSQTQFASSMSIEGDDAYYQHLDRSHSADVDEIATADVELWKRSMLDEAYWNGVPDITLTPSTARVITNLFPRQNDVVIVVMGTTGSGKSSFINQFHTNQPVVIGQGLESCTHEVDAYRCQDEELGTFWLIDTPGFGDTYRSDSEVLGDIANWLNKAYLSEIKLTGIIYVHAIREAWISRKATNSIQYFTRLCGPNALRKVVLVSTFWDTVDPSAGESREQELKNNPEYWADMIDRGSKAFRHYNSRSTARAVVRHLLNISTANDRGTYLTIQQEMVEQEKKLDETAAGIFMLEALRIHVLRKFKILGRSHSNVRDSLWR